VPWIPQRRPRACGRLRPRRDPGRAEILFAIAAFAALCAVALSFAPRLVEPDDFAYTWTTNGFVTTLQSARFYVPAIGAIALLGAWLLVRVPGRAALAAAVSVAVVAALFGLGLWSFGDMRVNQGPGRGIIGRLQPVPAGNPQIAPAAQAAHGTVWHHGVD
jgi:hypothetical protein